MADSARPKHTGWWWYNRVSWGVAAVAAIAGGVWAEMNGSSPMLGFLLGGIGVLILWGLSMVGWYALALTGIIGGFGVRVGVGIAEQTDTAVRSGPTRGRDV